MAGVFGAGTEPRRGRVGGGWAPSPLTVAVVLLVLSAVLGGDRARSERVDPDPNPQLSRLTSTVAAPLNGPSGPLAGSLPVAADGCGPGWATGWMTAPQAGPPDPSLDDATLRMIVRPQLTGSEIRLRLSNAYGTAPLRIAAAAVARSEQAATVAVGTVHALEFGGRREVLIPAGADVVSDPVPLRAEAGRALAVSLHLPVAPAVTTLQPVALQTSYLAAGGDLTLERDGSRFGGRIGSWPVLTAVEVRTPLAVNSVVAVGDSITTGNGSGQDSDQRWTDALSGRLTSVGGPSTMAVLNAGISGNQLLAEDPLVIGATPLNRFERDVDAAIGATDVVLNVGTNDIAAGRTPAAIIEGLRRFAEHTRAAGKRVFLTTITPSSNGAHGTRAAVATRDAVNAWIRDRGPQHADGVFDVAHAVADPLAPSRLAPAYDSGDGLHLSAAGYRAMAAVIDIDVLTGSPCLATDLGGTTVLISG